MSLSPPRGQTVLRGASFENFKHLSYLQLWSSIVKKNFGGTRATLHHLPRKRRATLQSTAYPVPQVEERFKSFQVPRATLHHAGGRSLGFGRDVLAYPTPAHTPLHGESGSAYPASTGIFPPSKETRSTARLLTTFLLLPTLQSLDGPAWPVGSALHIPTDQLPVRGTPDGARAPLFIFRKIHLYGETKKSTHGHQDQIPYCTHS